MTKKLLNKKIVILDACTVSNGDVDFGTFESLGDVKIYDVLNGDELTEACREAEVLLVNKTRVDEKLISACPRLELICLFATGYDNVDIEAAKRRGITVCNVPRYSAQSVTQHVFAMLLEYVRNICLSDRKSGGQDLRHTRLRQHRQQRRKRRRRFGHEGVVPQRNAQKKSRQGFQVCRFGHAVQAQRFSQSALPVERRNTSNSK